MSERPPPRPAWSRMNSTMRRAEMTWSTMMVEVSMWFLPDLRRSGRGLYHGAVLQREVTRRQLAPVVRGELRVVLLAHRELGSGTPRVEPAARRRIDR